MKDKPSEPTLLDRMLKAYGMTKEEWDEFVVDDMLDGPVARAVRRLREKGFLVLKEKETE